MAEQASLVQEGVDRFKEAFESLDLDRVQKNLKTQRKKLDTQRRKLEKQLTSSRRQWEKRTRKRVKQIQTDLRKSPLLKRVQSIQQDASSVLESGVDGILGSLRIASKQDVDRIDKKLGQISRKLREIERAREAANGSRPGN